MTDHRALVRGSMMNERTARQRNLQERTEPKAKHPLSEQEREYAEWRLAWLDLLLDGRP